MKDILLSFLPTFYYENYQTYRKAGIFQRKPLFPLPRSYNEHFDIFAWSYNYPTFYAYINPSYFLMHFKVNCRDDYTSAGISLTRAQYWFVGEFLNKIYRE